MASERSRVLAGIDLGTLTCRFLVARVTGPGKLVEVRADRRVLRLGEGVALSHRLNGAAMVRVLETLRAWRQDLHSLEVEAETVVATSAVREAENRGAFVERVRAETGFEVEVVTGIEEARRTMLGIRSGLRSSTDAVLGLDIGGGSTEFILDRSGRLPLLESMNLGVVRLTEEMFRHDPPTREELRAARARIDSAVEEVRARVGVLSGVSLVGTAGTITTLAAMAQHLTTYDPARIHNYALALNTLCALEDTLVQRSAAERRGLPGLERGREDVILAGAMILRGAMEAFRYTTCVVSDLGLREGIVFDLAARLTAGRSGEG